MLRFFTSLSFLYGFTIIILIVYGILYYKSFAKNRYQKKRFPWVFLLISVACFAFLYININAPLSLKTFSNLDHNFIRHDGFRVVKSIELGKTDTANFKTATFNRFVFNKKDDQVMVSSSYSEEPFYMTKGNGYKLLSASFAAIGHSFSFQADTLKVFGRAVTDSSFELEIDGTVFKTVKEIRKGITAWNLFRYEPGFINSPYYTNEKLISSLVNVFVLRDDVSAKKYGELKYFFSGRLFQYASLLQVDGNDFGKEKLVFTAAIPDKANVAWGVGFLDNNKNQFSISLSGKDSFNLVNRYPVSYPLSEENRGDWKNHRVNKFLVSGSGDIVDMPDIFNEGFLFAAFDGDSSVGFYPVLLSFQKDRGNASPVLQAGFMNHSVKEEVAITNHQLILPAKSSGFSWVFSIQDTFNWKLGNRMVPASTWQLLIFGSLAFFFLLVFCTSLLQPAFKLSWVWQLLSCVTLVLLTTRFFLYWRYKSFPPFESLDLPSVQQLNSFWNFGIIVFATLVLALLFGFRLIKYVFSFIKRKSAGLLNKSYGNKKKQKVFFSSENVSRIIQQTKLVKKAGLRFFFFLSWGILLFAGALVAAFNNFNPSVCRHLAIGLIILYFIFIYFSYEYSPLVVSSEKSWWKLSTGKSMNLIINNPIKVLLSVSLLALFVFVDIGFAIVFLNFLLFNEAFLCINYAIAGLSAGSKKNAGLFGFLGVLYLLLFVLNLTYGPYIFTYLLGLPQLLYTTGYILFSICIAYTAVRLLYQLSAGKKLLAGIGLAIFLFLTALLFFPKERILSKAAMTRYRIDVMAMPVEKAIETAYEDGKNYTPVIRAAQNQWFINTFIYEKNNPAVNGPFFQLLPHAPQNKGAKYNAQATDLVASRFLIAEHGKIAVLLFVLLLMLPTTLLASFYKLYPDFTNRVNNNYPTITTGFSLLNYLLITTLLVILAATGRYIFFGQDLPFGSILSKQSILFPCALIVATIWLFNKVPLEQYPNRKKMFPGLIVFTGLGLLLFLFKPAFNKDKEFTVNDMAKNMDSYIESRLQPVFDYLDSSARTRRLSLKQKDQLFTDSVKNLLATGYLQDAGKFFLNQLERYTNESFSRHLDQRRMLYLDVNSGRPQLAVNDNYFRIEPPPHLQQYWKGNVYGDTSNYNINLWDATKGIFVNYHFSSYGDQQTAQLDNGLTFIFKRQDGKNLLTRAYLVNNSGHPFSMIVNEKGSTIAANDTVAIHNPDRIRIINAATGTDKVITVQPDAFMKNYYVNGSRYYVYPMKTDFIWARNFAEAVAADYTGKGLNTKNVFISLDAMVTDSLSAKIQWMMKEDTSYHTNAEYGICIADGNGRLIAMSDFIKGMDRPDPNDKAGFNSVLQGENGMVTQSLLRKQVGNINLLRMNPGPGSTLKPIVFAAVASQLNIDWNAFASEGFNGKQQYYGSEKVAEYDFEKNNGRINAVKDYLRHSDNYYHSNVLLLGSYSRQNFKNILAEHFASHNPEKSLHWPYFSYQGRQYWLDGFENWPGYMNGKANFGSDSSFVSIGLLTNFDIYPYNTTRNFDKFKSPYDSALFLNAAKKSGFILPEFSLFDQKGTGIDHRIPYDVFMSSFRGHVKGSSQVMIPPVKMTEAFGKLISQNKEYELTLNPYAASQPFVPFYVDNDVTYSQYLSLMKGGVFEGMREALFSGTAARLGAVLKEGKPYYYYAKTGTTGDDNRKEKSKLFTIIISEKKITDPDFNFRNNKFYVIYFTSQNGPAKQNEKFQAEVIKYVEESAVFKNYMNGQEKSH